MEGYGSEPSVYPSNVEGEELSRLEQHRRGLQKHLSQVDEQIATITNLGLNKEVVGDYGNGNGFGIIHQESTSIEKSSGYGSTDSSGGLLPKEADAAQFSNSEFVGGSDFLKDIDGSRRAESSISMAAALMTNHRPQTQDSNKKGWWDSNASERKRHSHHYGHTYNNYVAQYTQYHQMQQQQQQHSQQYYGSYDSMYQAQYNQYQPQGQRNYASIEQFATYAAQQLEHQAANREARMREMRHAHEVAMFQQYGGANMTNLFEYAENRPASASGTWFQERGGAVRSSSTPDRLKNKPVPLEPMPKGQLAWYLKNPLEFNAAIDAAVRSSAPAEAPSAFTAATGIHFTTPVTAVAPPPGFEKVERQ